jgi:hypothetical protein
MPSCSSLNYAVLTLALLAPCRIGSAQTRDATALAREEFQRGVGAAKQRDYAAAVEHFQAAQALHSAPTILFNLASALYELQRSPEAYETLLQLDPSGLQEPLRARVQQLRANTRARIALVLVHGAQAGYTLRVDGVDRPGLATGGGIAVEAGPHRLEIVDGERSVIERGLYLEQGTQYEIDVAESVAPAPAPAPAAAEPTVAQPLPAPGPLTREEREPHGVSPSRRRLYAELGVAVALAVAVAVAVPLAMRSHRSQEPEAPPTSGFVPGVLSW